MKKKNVKPKNAPQTGDPLRDVFIALGQAVVSGDTATQREIFHALMPPDSRCQLWEPCEVCGEQPCVEPGRCKRHA